LLARTLAVTTAVRAQMPPSDELEERRYARAGHQIDAATPTAVSAIGATEGHELLAAERDDAVAAVPSFYPDAPFVDVNTHASLCRLRVVGGGLAELRLSNSQAPTAYPRQGSVLRPTRESPRFCVSTGAPR